MNDQVLLYSSSLMEIKILQEVLVDNDIPSKIQNDLSTSAIAGFAAGTETTVRLWVHPKNFEKANKLLDEFKKS